MRRKRRLFSIFSIILGISALLGWLGVILMIEAIALLGVIYGLFAPVWALWLGIDLIRKPIQIQMTYN
jgi:hypothetical protein